MKDYFTEIARVSNLQLNLDRQTGFVAGYALIEYEQKDDAIRAIETLNGSKFMGQEIRVDWGFVGPSNVDISTTERVHRKRHRLHHRK